MPDQGLECVLCLIQVRAANPSSYTNYHVVRRSSFSCPQDPRSDCRANRRGPPEASGWHRGCVQQTQGFPRVGSQENPIRVNRKLGQSIGVTYGHLLDDSLSFRFSLLQVPVQAIIWLPNDCTFVHVCLISEHLTNIHEYILLQRKIPK